MAKASGVGSDGWVPTNRVSTPNVPSSAQREHRRVMTEPGGGHGDVGRSPADGLAERAHLVEWHTELLGVEIDADPPDRQQLDRRIVEVIRRAHAELGHQCLHLSKPQRRLQR